MNDSKGSTTTGIVNDVLHDTLDVAVSFGIVDGSEPGGSLPVFRVRHEDWTSSFTLSTNHTTHVFIGFFFGDKNNRVLSARNVKRKRKFNWWTDQNKLVSNLSQANLTFFSFLLLKRMIPRLSTHMVDFFWIFKMKFRTEILLLMSHYLKKKTITGRFSLPKF